MEKQLLSKCWKLVNGALVLIKEVETDVQARQLKMAVRDLGLVKDLLGKALDRINQDEVE